MVYLTMVAKLEKMSKASYSSDNYTIAFPLIFLFFIFYNFILFEVLWKLKMKVNLDSFSVYIDIAQDIPQPYPNIAVKSPARQNL